MRGMGHAGDAQHAAVCLRVVMLMCCSDNPDATTHPHIFVRKNSSYPANIADDQARKRHARGCRKVTNMQCACDVLIARSCAAAECCCASRTQCAMQSHPQNASPTDGHGSGNSGTTQRRLGSRDAPQHSRVPAAGASLEHVDGSSNHTEPVLTRAHPYCFPAANVTRPPRSGVAAHLAMIIGRCPTSQLRWQRRRRRHSVCRRGGN
jgi:hypothetical protein